jgi:hypothetical protein
MCNLCQHLLDADAEGVDWREVARIVLHIDPDREPDRVRQAFEKRGHFQHENSDAATRS